MTVDAAYTALYSGALVVFAVLIGAMLVRAAIGPRVTDRILSINMIGTMVICCIILLTVFLKEAYLADVALIYALVSFVTVLVFAAVYIPAHKKSGNKKSRDAGRTPSGKSVLPAMAETTGEEDTP